MRRQKLAGLTNQGQGTQLTVKDWNELLRDKCHADNIWPIMAAQKAAEGAFWNTEERVIASMFSGIWKSRCLSVLVSLGIPELLCESSESVRFCNYRSVSKELPKVKSTCNISVFSTCFTVAMCLVLLH